MLRDRKGFYLLLPSALSWLESLTLPTYYRALWENILPGCLLPPAVHCQPSAALFLLALLGELHSYSPHAFITSLEPESHTAPQGSTEQA